MNTRLAALVLVPAVGALSAGALAGQGGLRGHAVGWHQRQAEPYRGDRHDRNRGDNQRFRDRRPEHRGGDRPGDRPGDRRGDRRGRPEPRYSHGKPYYWHGEPSYWRGHPYWRLDIRHFDRDGYAAWRGGYWHHGWYGGRWGWWWVVGGIWYYYAAPIYPYPNPYVPGNVVVVQQPAAEPAAPAPPTQAPAQYWYHCSAPDGYYPYVAECPGGWSKVPATPPPAAPAPAQSTPPPHGSP